jgi:hypothetical protein
VIAAVGVRGQGKPRSGCALAHGIAAIGRDLGARARRPDAVSVRDVAALQGARARELAYLRRGT